MQEPEEQQDEEYEKSQEEYENELREEEQPARGTTRLGGNTTGEARFQLEYAEEQQSEASTKVMRLTRVTCRMYVITSRRGSPRKRT